MRDRWLRLWFSDGAIIDVDGSAIVADGPVFAPIRCDQTLFEQIRVDRDAGTVVWPGDVDVDPDVLYGRFAPASGKRVERRVVRAAPGAAS